MLKNLKEMIYKSAEIYGAKNAYKEYSYSEVKNIVDSLGSKLIDMGLKDKRIAVIGENRFEWEMAYLAITCGTGVVVPLDKSLPANELCSVIKRSEVEAIFFSKKYSEDLWKIKYLDNNLKYLICMDRVEENGVFNFDDLVVDGRKLLEAGDRRFIDAEIDNEKIGMMLFTSGTTSESKIVALSHKNVCANLVALKDRLKTNSEDVFLSVLPIHHVFECTVGFLLALYSGAETVFSDSVRHIMENLKEHKVTFMACVPGIYEKIFKMLKKRIEKSENKESALEMLGGKIRLLISGAAPLDKSIEEGYRELGFNLVQGYGLTETSPVVAIGGPDIHRIGSVGTKLPNLEIEILEPNESGVGELAAKGPSIMMGYFGNEEATVEVLNDGWFKTGDLAKIDDDGYVYICGRKKNVIVLKNGKNIYPEEMEVLINKIDGVEESMIFGSQKSEKENDIKIDAVVVINKELFKENYFKNLNLSIEEFWEKSKEYVLTEIKKINEIMPKYKSIKDVIITENPLIKTTTNKVKRQATLDAIRKLEC